MLGELLIFLIFKVRKFALPCCGNQKPGNVENNLKPANVWKCQHPICQTDVIVNETKESGDENVEKKSPPWLFHKSL